MNKTWKRILCLCAALVLALGTLSAQAWADFTPALDPDTEGRIRVVGSYNNFESLEAEFDAFNRYYPEVELSYTRLDDYNNILATALSGDRPNIYFTYPWMIGQEMYAPALAAAEDLSDPALGIDLSCFREELLYTDPDGRVPMAPIFATTYGMLVNEDLFKQVGLAIPQTYSELKAACGAFQAAGYDTPVLGYYDNGSNMLYSLIYPYVCGLLKDDPEAVAGLNAFEPGAAESLRPALELVKDFMDSGCVNKESCQSLEDNYGKMILRFFEGDIPMLICNGDTVSGTAKREAQSDTFVAHPFPYSFHPVPVTEEGGWFVNSVSFSFSVCKDCDDLAITNEFMRFLLSTQELNEIARVKRLLTTSADFSMDGVYAAFGDVDADHAIYTESVGLLDAPVVQIRKAAYAVAEGTMTIDEAIENFGSIPG